MASFSRLNSGNPLFGCVLRRPGLLHEPHIEAISWFASLCRSVYQPCLICLYAYMALKNVVHKKGFRST